MRHLQPHPLQREFNQTDVRDSSRVRTSSASHSDNKNHLTDWDADLSKREKEPKTFRGLLVRFAEYTSLQGIPFINRASRKTTRIIWILVTLAAATAAVYQSYYICKSFYSYETVTSVSIGYTSLSFPSVTLCNINPIRSTALDEYGSEELQEFISSIAPPTDLSGRGAARRETPSGGDGQTNQDDQAPGGGDQTNQDDQAPGGSDQTNQDGQAQPGSPSRRRRASVAGLGPPVDGTNQNSPPEAGQSTSLSDEEQPRDFGSGNVSAEVDNLNTFQSLFAAEDDETRELLSNKKETLILECSFNGLECSPENFTAEFHSEFGFCYTFNSYNSKDRNVSLNSATSGPTYGLTLTLFIEEYNYIQGLGQGRGVRLDVHPYNTMSFIHETGIALGYGLEHFVGMRMINITRLGEPYAPCDDNGTMVADYGTDYTIGACITTCLERFIATDCRCYREAYEEYYPGKDLEGLLSCNTSDPVTAVCIERNSRNYVNGRLDCGCNQACHAQEYDIMTSSNQWPDQSLWYSLINALCEVDDDACDELQSRFESNPEDGEELLRKNFLKIRLYYRDLNYQSLTDQAAYETSQFLSDFGGTIGLWIGASFLTAVEFMDFLFQCCNFCARRKVYKKRKERTGSEKANSVKPRADHSLQNGYTMSPFNRTATLDSKRQPYGFDNHVSPGHKRDYYGPY